MKSQSYEIRMQPREARKSAVSSRLAIRRWG
jgi:hypothetical protein